MKHLNFDSERVVLLAHSRKPPTRSSSRLAATSSITSGAFSNPDSAYYLTHDFEPIGEDDLFVFYFSGHGLRTDNGQHDLLPMEASNQDVTKTAVLLDEVVTGIEPSHACTRRCSSMPAGPISRAEQ